MAVVRFCAKAYNLLNNQCHSISNFTITSSVKPVANAPGDYIICENLPYDNIEQFDLSTKNIQVLGSQAAAQYTISYHSSQADADNDVNTLPFVYSNVIAQETIYVRIENVSNPTCFSTTSFIISVVQQPTVNNVSDYLICDDVSNNGIATFDLNLKSNEILGTLPATAFNVKYYYTQQDAADDINSITAPVENTGNNQVIYFSIQAISNGGCKAIGSFKLVVSPIPVANQPQDLRRCDDTSNNGFEIFDLTVNTPAILATQIPNQFSVSYFSSLADAQAGTNAIIGDYENISNPQTVYVRIENILNSNCYSVTNFQIKVDTLPYTGQANNLYECSTNSYANFNLSILNDDLLSGQNPSQYSVSYYSSFQDAELGISPLSENYSNISNPQIIYARVENKTNDTCYAITDFRLIVHQNPIMEMNEVYSLCENENVIIQAPLGFDSYHWSTGEESTFKIFSEPGEYTLTVGVDYDDIICQTTKEIKIVNSNVASIIEVITTDWTENQNVIHIVAEGLGRYEYSLDNITYQDSPVFAGLEGGAYTIYVRDINGCGVTFEEVHLLTYPKFFTPNGDGINEFWNINLAYYEPALEVNILDRYGKIITSFKGNSTGWDGIYNGQPLPATDYWFIVTRKGGRKFRGHFSLIR